MSLATLLNMPDFNDPRSINEWSFSNMDEHRKIVETIYVKNGTLLNIYPLDPVPVSNVVFWLQLHQQAHNDFTSVLGIENFDISSVDFRNQAQVDAWIRLHFDMHYVASQQLGLN